MLRTQTSSAPGFSKPIPTLEEQTENSKFGDACAIRGNMHHQTPPLPREREGTPNKGRPEKRIHACNTTPACILMLPRHTRAAKTTNDQTLTTLQQMPRARHQCLESTKGTPQNLLTSNMRPRPTNQPRKGSLHCLRRVFPQTKCRTISKPRHLPSQNSTPSVLSTLGITKRDCEGPDNSAD